MNVNKVARSYEKFKSERTKTGYAIELSTTIKYKYRKFKQK